MIRQLRPFFLIIILSVFVRASVFGASLPSGFTESQVAAGLSSPTAMAFAPDGRLFVCEQSGKLRVIKNGQLLANPFLQVTVSSTGERGLLGVAFDPSFSTNQFVYVYYTATTPAIHNRVSRFTANGDQDVPGSEVVIFELNNLSGATNHNGGAMHFGKDGKLYIAVGENATGSNSQTLSNLLGKMLRINKDGTIPTDNPYYNTATGNNRAIWTMGLRNPFTFDVQPGTGRIFINDVGQDHNEEINDGIAGSNYGWPSAEGESSCGTFRCPVFSYDHGSGSTRGCAITGGVFYNPQTNQFPSDYTGDYFFAEYCNGWIRRYDPASDTATGFATGLSNAVDLKVSPDGSLHYLQRGSGTSTGVIYKIQYTASQSPSITTEPSDLIVSVGQAATFTVAASGSTPLSYQWQRNSVDISGATSASYTLTSAQLNDSGALFRCKVTNSSGSATSNTALLTVTANTVPTANITQPTDGTLYSAGITVNYAGTGTDLEDGTLPASAFTWQVDFHHDTHTHPFILPTSGSKSGSFVIPTTGETSDNVWYRIYLTVKDSGNLTKQTFVEIVPRKSTVTLASNPTGLQLKLDGQQKKAPTSFDGVVGIVRTVQAISPQTLNNITYDFTSWSDGGNATHNISTPPSNTTYTASFNARPTASISAPANGASFTAPENITINASASDSNGTISKVEFFNGGTLLGSDTSSPYTFAWNNVGAGNYNLTVKATDNQASTVTSSVVAISVVTNGSPTVNITAPANGSNFTAPADITINANANDDGSISKVEFFRGTTLLGSDTSSPYSFSWNNVSAGNYTLTAKATDNQGSVTTSAGVAISVTADSAPTVSITSPANGSTFTAPADITINANAADDGTINKVEFFRGTTLLGSDTSSPYSFAWNNVSVGNYTLTAKATDNQGSVTTSTGVAISVIGNSAPTVNITSPANGADFTAPADITINANAADGDGTITKVEFFNGSTNIGQDTSSPYSFAWNNRPAGTYTLTAKAIDNSNNTTTSAVVNVTVDSSLPSPWSGKDIGSVGMAGSEAQSNGVFTLNASGADIWGSSDEFRYVYRQWSGNGQIVAKINSVEHTNDWAKAGIMIRQSLNANSINASILITPGNGVSFQRRVTTGGTCTANMLNGKSAPYWVKLARKGNVLTSYTSSDGTSWQQLGSDTMSLPGNIYFGLAVSSHNNSTLNTSAFSNVSVASSAFVDEFNDGNLSNWTSSSGDWNETNGSLVGRSDKKGDIFPLNFAGCDVCTVEAEMKIQTGERLSLFGWYVDKKTLLELMMDEGSDKWIVKYKADGDTIGKKSISLPIRPGTNYHVKIQYSGTKFDVYVDDTLILSLDADSVVGGTVGFRVKEATGIFNRISVL